MGWRELIRICQRPLTDGRWRIYHARRNIEMIAGLILRRVFNCKIHLVFTSTAQREHTWLTKFLYRRMDTLLTTSPRAARFLKRDPDYTIPHGIDTRTYQPAPDKKQAWSDGGLPGQYGVGIFGRVRPQKGHREFIDALCEVLPKHPHFTAVVIGRQRARPWSSWGGSRTKEPRPYLVAMCLAPGRKLGRKTSCHSPLPTKIRANIFGIILIV